MPKVSFDEVEAPASEQGKELATKPESTLAMPSIADPEKGLVGEWTQEDVRLPRLNLVNKSGDLSNLFTPGVWAIQKEHAISEIDPSNKERGLPIKVIAARAMKQYQENIPWDLRDSVTARIFNSAQEVRAAGGMVGFKRGEGIFAAIAHIEFFIEKPEKLGDEASALFTYTFGDTDYARVIYTASSSAFSAVGVPLASSVSSAGHLRDLGFSGGFWLLGSELKKDTKNSWWQPTFKSAGLVPDAIRDEIKSVL